MCDVENSDLSRTTVWFVLGMDQRPSLINEQSNSSRAGGFRGSILLASYTRP
ncbi:hypothetical protein BT69DRAFT_1280830 [Atractiella rhizophila]|nr:hypothetical protein BT69DRAFT_1280830 [Atractiella rhizophila]